MPVSGLRDKQERAAHAAWGFPWHPALIIIES